MPQFRFGDIVEVEQMLDPKGQNPKIRPALILTPTAEIAQSESLVVAAISSSHIPEKLPEAFVELPFADGGRCKTGLIRRSVVVCTWLEEISKSRILRKLGGAPGTAMELVAEFLAKQKSE